MAPGARAGLAGGWCPPVHAWLPDALFFTRSRAGGQETIKEEKMGQIVEWMFSVFIL